jgi:phosphoribosylglycinamide formyltransferase-1
LAGFLAILSEDFVKDYKERIINVHPSLIPSFCGQGYYGLIVHEKALEKGVKVTGATVHFVNEIPDGGKIIMQKAVEIKEGDTPEVLQKRIMEEAEWKILPLSCEKICSEIIKEKC